MFGILIFFFVPAFLGWLVLGMWGDALSQLERIGLGYGLGAGLFTYIVFLLSLAGLPISLWTGAGIIALSIAMLLAILWRARKLESIRLTPIALNFSATEWLIVGLIGAVVPAAFALAVYWQPYAWDALSAWLLKGKLIAATGTLALLDQTAAPYFPLSVSLQVAYLYLLDGSFVQIVFPIYLASLLIVFYANLRELTNRFIALVCTLFLSATPILFVLSFVGYGHVPFAFYYVGSCLYLFKYWRQRTLSWLVLSALLMACAAWTRSEAALYLAINLVVMVLCLGINRTMLKALAVYGAHFLDAVEYFCATCRIHRYDWLGYRWTVGNF